MTTHPTHHDDCGRLRERVVKMLREERDRMESLAKRFAAQGDERTAHLMRVRANCFDMSADMVEMMT